MTTTFDRLCAILARDYPLRPEQLTPDAPLDALGIDSLGVAELLFNVEDAFGITLPSEPVALQTIGDVARFIDSLVPPQGPAQPDMPAQSLATPVAVGLGSSPAAKAPLP